MVSQYMEISHQSPVRIPLSAGIQPSATKPVFRLETGPVSRFGEEDRTAGSMPVWGAAQTQAEKIAQAASAESAHTTEIGNTLLPEAAPLASGEEPFGFGDLVDMVNPLQHIPLVNLAYRQMTGDEIRPIGKVIGGSLFAGPFGAGSALVDIGLKSGTGKDMSEYAFAAAGMDTRTQTSSGTVEAAPLAYRAEAPPAPSVLEGLPGTTLALADMGASRARAAGQFKSFALND